MAFDVGSKRIGIAVADPTGTYALPVATIHRRNRRDDLAEIDRCLTAYQVDELVIGDPITLKGQRDIAAREMDEFVESLRAIFDGPVHRVDERLTTAQASKALIAADLSRAKRRAVVDRTAAALILETFLAQRRRQSQA